MNTLADAIRFVQKLNLDERSLIARAIVIVDAWQQALRDSLTDNAPSHERPRQDAFLTIRPGSKQKDAQ